MDEPELRLRKIELILRAVETSVQLQSHRRIAVLGASLAVGGGAGVGAVVGQLPAIQGVVIVFVAGAVILDQFRGLLKDSEDWGTATAQALRNIDKLMPPEVEHDADAEEADESRT